MEMSMFRVFLWKNFKYLRFHWLRTVFILSGCLILFFIVMFTTHAERKQSRYFPEPINEETFNFHLSSEPEDVICYVPYDPWLDDFMESVRRDLSIIPDRWQSFNTTTEMSLLMDKKKNTKSFFIYFDKFPADNQKSLESTNLSYTISATHGRVSTSQVYYNDREVVGMQIFDDYTSSGFLALQNAIDKKYIEKRTGKNAYPIEIAPFPAIELLDVDSFRVIFAGLLFMLFIYIIILTTFIVPLVEEKHDGMQAYLVLATSKSYLNRISFYIIRCVIYLVFTMPCLVIAYYYVENIQFLYFSILCLLFILSTMNYAMLISIFLKSVHFANIGGFLAFFVPTVLFSIESSVFHKFAFLMSGNVFLQGLKVLQIFTIKRRDFTREDINLKITNSSPTLFDIYCTLIIQELVYIALYNYLANVFPGVGGVRKPFYYIFEDLKRCFSNKDSKTSCGNLNSKVSIEIIDLCKNFSSYGSKMKVAIDKLNMSVERNKITVLLGHNGAGKTTTIHTIIGSVEKTSGNIFVNGETDVEKYRNSIGYCPQHNIFMQYMTCQEHLYFFSRLRGLSSVQAKEESYGLLCDLLLKEKANEVGENLSGGMKRRLALGMAIAGQTSVAILDEPTSGLDPESRRTLWDILIKLRKKRSILITTHYMEEAEILGDEIVIMSQGKLVCSGHPMDLKHEHGSGYILKLLTNADFQWDKTLEYIHTFIKDAVLHTIVEPTYCLRLPYKDRHVYSTLLKGLEYMKKELGVCYISVANSSLEDVFLNCMCDGQSDRSQVDAKCPSVSPEDALMLFVLIRQFIAVFYKKLIYLKRKWIYTLIMCSFPFVTIMTAFWIMNADTSSRIVDGSHSLQIDIPNSEIYVKFAPGFSKFENFLNTEIRNMNAIPIYVNQHESLEETLLSIQEKNITHFYDRIYGAFELRVNGDDQPIIKVLYSSNIIHSSATLINLLNNAVVKFLYDKNSIINTHIRPISRSIVISPARLEYFSSIVPIGCFFYMLFYSSLPFREKRTQFNKLQNIPRLVYWFSFTSFDIVLHVLVSCSVYIALLIWDTKDIYGNEYGEKMKFAVVFAFYGIGYLPLLYILANSFRSISSLSTYLFVFLIVSTIIPIMTSINQKAIQSSGFAIYVLMLLPDFALKHELMVINENYFIHRRNAIKVESQDEPLNEMPFYIYMVILFVTLEAFLIICWDNIYYRQRFFRFSQNPCNRKTRIDDDIALDEVDSSQACLQTSQNESLRVQDLHKYYGRNNDVHAVQGINFNVGKGECFGLLGLNGAGKSSTFEMITGNEPISKGSVSIEGADIITEKNRFNTLYGYCPQVDALNNFMTSGEILSYLALLRGIPRKKINPTVQYWLKELDLIKYQDVPIKYYSGGTKRKLNTAMAMIGDPAVVFLDEPTTGVDPVSRRFMWECIRDFKRNRKTIVLTSHSMDECENLCNRLAIMAKGKIQCMDCIPKLKERYGDAFTITIRLKENCNAEGLAQLQAQMSKHFDCSIREHHDSTIVYLVKAKPWATVFDEMETLLRGSGSDIIRDYCVSETTLEDIFLKMK